MKRLHMFSILLLLVGLSSACIADDFASERDQTADTDTDDTGDAGDTSEDVDREDDDLEGEAIFVSSEDGNNSQNGMSPDQPVATIDKGMRLAVDEETEDGKPFALAIAGGTYEEVVEVEPGVDLLGGFSAEDWSREFDSDDEYRTLIRPPADAADEHVRTVIADGIDQQTLLSGLHIEGFQFDRRSPGDHPGASSYAVWINESDDFVALEDSVVVAGEGAAGSDGEPGEDGAEDASCDDSYAGGEKGEFETTNHCKEPEDEEAPSGLRGIPTDEVVDLIGGEGGSGGLHFCANNDHSSDACRSGDINGVNGDRGTKGGDGSDARPATDVNGSFDDGFWQSPAAAERAQSGQPGSGGGGGGAGGNCSDNDGTIAGIGSFHNNGGNGGDGGQGGCPGEPGESGQPGGGSFGIFVAASNLEASKVTVRVGRGGDGGDGAAGGVGVDGTTGDEGKLGDHTSGFDRTRAGRGGDGGDGGPGGDGGDGAGGAGGPSVGVATADTATVDGLSDDNFDRNNAEPGRGGDGANEEEELLGPDGLEQNTLDFDD
ncbi:MAG: hypothetical protein ACOCV2_08395 [Persicimonas sp.]